MKTRSSIQASLALRRALSLYRRRGYRNDWITKRVSGVSARNELTSQWYLRGARESEEFRSLTNDLLRESFGLDAQEFLRLKPSGALNLRDQMTEMELALTTLAETTAAYIHKSRGSLGYDELRRDVVDAGQVVHKARQELEQRLTRPRPGNSASGQVQRLSA